MTKLLICGSRNCTPIMIAQAWNAVKRASELNWEIVVGDASGIDRAVTVACKHYKVPYTCYGVLKQPRNGNHEKYVQIAKATYYQRDEEMVKRADKVYAIWNGSSRGTKYTYDYAIRLGKEAWIWSP